MTRKSNPPRGYVAGSKDDALSWKATHRDHATSGSGAQAGGAYVCVIAPASPGAEGALDADAARVALEREFVRPATREERARLNLPARALAVVSYGELAMTLRYTFIRPPPRYARLAPAARLAAAKSAPLLARSVVWRTNDGVPQPVIQGGRA